MKPQITRGSFDVLIELVVASKELRHEAADHKLLWYVGPSI